ncbi:hypothetical protein HCN44_001601 [Aphidius gifuensis]|uniref:Serine/threonine/tyrosine-interacting protein n=1 Tax=Aphidius gifuensis TaxID=684658 RepID=A0A834XT06_APHGI|nr:hypothetical protein HCN44_001601 [Aphidius gifuensis]
MLNNNEFEDPASVPNMYPSLPQILEPDWEYSMRRSMQEIIPGLYLGPYNAASKTNLKELLDIGVTHIVCVRGQIEAHFIRPNFPDKFKYLVLNITDTTGENIIQHFGVVKTFVDEALNNKGRVLVHGNAGISRCTTLVVAYLMETYGLDHTQAFGLVRKRRFCVSPSDRFMSQLKEFEPIYRARKSREISNSNSNNSKKRSLQDMDLEYTME